ncbi:MAG: hypothetical protein I8H96_07225 [Sphingomonadaceae bacterium]|nr:hypothetical protein [Sphingomonadaceae bacterium]
MIWAKGVRRAIAGTASAGLCAGLGLATPAVADTMVVRASGPSAKSYPPGSKLSDGGSLLLKAGDMVTLLDAKGTRTLQGPGTFGVTAASVARGNNVTLNALLDTKRVRRARTGAVRGNVSDGQAATPKRPNVWLVDVAQPGALCFADPATVLLWRADASAPASVRITSDHAQATASFAAGAAMTAWPTTLPVADGAAYRISLDAMATDIRFAQVTPTDPGLETVAAGLIARGCDAQLNLLVDAAEQAKN